MALTYGFYNSLNGDRKYHAEQMSSIFDGVINDGVFAGIGDKLFTVAGTGMQVIVKTGRAWFNHTWTLNDSNLTLPIQAADSNLTRIDAVVLEVDHTDAVRANSIKVLKGTPASSPQPPSLLPSKNATKTQHLLAKVTVKAKATTITTSDIDIRVGQTETPFVTSILQQTDISQVYATWKAKFDTDLATWKNQFDTWFAHIQTVLSEEVVTNLQRQITENKNNFANYLRTADFDTKFIAKRATAAEVNGGQNVNKFVAPSDITSYINNKVIKTVEGTINVNAKTQEETGEYPPARFTFDLSNIKTQLSVINSQLSTLDPKVLVAVHILPTIDLYSYRTGETSKSQLPNFSHASASVNAIYMPNDNNANSITARLITESSNHGDASTWYTLKNNALSFNYAKGSSSMLTIGTLYAAPVNMSYLYENYLSLEGTIKIKVVAI